MTIGIEPLGVRLDVGSDLDLQGRGEQLSSAFAHEHEKAGLLPAPERTAADYRSYDESAVDRLRFIQGGQRLGLRLQSRLSAARTRSAVISPD